jgi:hypothetical protein
LMLRCVQTRVPRLMGPSSPQLERPETRSEMGTLLPSAVSSAGHRFQQIQNRMKTEMSLTWQQLHHSKNFFMCVFFGHTSFFCLHKRKTNPLSNFPKHPKLSETQNGRNLH